jgi:hypothetical protein
MCTEDKNKPSYHFTTPCPCPYRMRTEDKNKTKLPLHSPMPMPMPMPIRRAQRGIYVYHFPHFLQICRTVLKCYTYDIRTLKSRRTKPKLDLFLSGLSNL